MCGSLWFGLPPWLRYAPLLVVQDVVSDELSAIFEREFGERLLEPSQLAHDIALHTPVTDVNVDASMGSVLFGPPNGRPVHLLERSS